MGQLFDDQSNLPIPYATIRIGSTPYGTSTNIDGRFTLDLADIESDNLKLICSSVGYHSFDTLLNQVNMQDLVISLAPMSIMLEAVSVYPNLERIKQVNDMVEQAMKGLKKACPPFQAKADLKHYVLEDGKYVKYKEGEITINDPKGFGKADSYYKISDIITYQGKRESLELSTDRIDFKNNTLSTYFDPDAYLLLNGLKYKFRATDYSYTVEDTLNTDGVNTYIINATDGNPLATSAKNFIEKYDLRFHLRENSRDKYDYEITKYELIYQSTETFDHLVQTENTIFSIDLESAGRYLQPTKIEHLLIQEADWKYLPEIREKKMISYHEISFNSVDFQAKNLKEVPQENWHYNKNDWQGQPLDEQVRKDLSNIVPIERQFAVQHDTQLRIQLQDSIDQVLFKRLYHSLQGKKSLYLIFWDREHIPIGNKLFWPGSGVISNEYVETIFIGNIQSRADWSYVIDGSPYLHFLHFNMPLTWKAVIPDIDCSANLPLYVLLDKQGKMKCDHTPFSKEQIMGLK
ncbi:MAG: carboxypeptidase-like regulatory domain-containing protein [Bacteroidota bacterium]